MRLHVPAVSPHEMTSAGTFSTLSKVALSALDLYGSDEHCKIVDSREDTYTSEVSNFEATKRTCSSCSSLGGIVDGSARTIHTEASEKLRW